MPIKTDGSNPGPAATAQNSQDANPNAADEFDNDGFADPQEFASTDIEVAPGVTLADVEYMQEMMRRTKGTHLFKQMFGGKGAGKSPDKSDEKAMGASQNSEKVESSAAAAKPDDGQSACAGEPDKPTKNSSSAPQEPASSSAPAAPAGYVGPPLPGPMGNG